MSVRTANLEIALQEQPLDAVTLRAEAEEGMPGNQDVRLGAQRQCKTRPGPCERQENEGKGPQLRKGSRGESGPIKERSEQQQDRSDRLAQEE